jgi:LPS export ABC transporter permease LptG/LPS export ABC transporter permease LptF
MPILDRYVVRQVLAPFAPGLLVFTFFLIIPGLMEYAEGYIAKGVPLPIVARLVATLLPQALALTLPMSLLLGLLVAFGRLSSDRELVALQACGVSAARLLRPVLLVSALCCAATLYVLLVAVPAGNQLFREVTFGVLASHAEGEVKPRVFFEDLPGVVLYVRDVPPEGGWNGVFMVDNRAGLGSTIYFAQRGRIVIDESRRRVELVLEEGWRHQHAADLPEKYEVGRFDRQVLALDPDAVFPVTRLPKGEREMSIPELSARAAELRAEGLSPHNPLFEIQQKYAIAAACVVFGLLGLALGVSHRREATLGSFVMGVVVVFVYYVVLWLGRSLMKGQVIPPWLGAWLPNALLGVAGVVLLARHLRAGERGIVLRVPPSLRGPWVARGQSAAWTWLPLSTLDRYILRRYLRLLGLSGLGLAVLFYVATFVEYSERVFKGEASWRMLAEFLALSTPQYLYYIVPLAVLLASLITVALFTKHSELVAMKACGISLYRIAVPLVAGAVAGGAVLVGLDQTVLGAANRRAEAIRHVMRGGEAATFNVLNRRWVAGPDGEIYHYDYFDPGARRFLGLWVLEFDHGLGRLKRRTFAQSASWVAATQDGRATWRLERGWTRVFDGQGEPAGFRPYESMPVALPAPSHFTTEAADPAFMNYGQLKSYTDQLGQGGFDVTGHRVALARKVSFPFVTLVMALIAVPFAVSIGRSGTLAGIGVAIAIAILYWTATSLFGAFGAGGAIAPTLAAWAPNLLFGATAAYLLLTVRT